MSYGDDDFESPYVEVGNFVQDRPYWGGFHENKIMFVLEANRRFLEVTQDPRMAATLTLSWAMLLSGVRE